MKIIKNNTKQMKNIDNSSSKPEKLNPKISDDSFENTYSNEGIATQTYKNPLDNQINLLPIRKPSKEFYKVKAKSSKCCAQDSLIIFKSTPSGNFDVILNKEFENVCKKNLDKYADKYGNYNVLLNKSESGNIEFDFKTDKNADDDISVVKLPSGNMKIITRKQIHNEINKVKFNGEISSLKKMEEKTFNKSTLAYDLNDDINKYEYYKILLQDSKNQISETYAFEKKVLGYSIFSFTEMSPEQMLKIKDFLANTNQCYVPIKKVGTREIIILFDKNKITSCKETFGLIKMSVFDKLLIIIDEKTMHTIEYDAAQTPSRHIIEPIKCPKNQSVNTSCNGTDIVEGGYCNTEKCDCNSLPTEVKRFWLPHNIRSEIKHIKVEGLSSNYVSLKEKDNSYMKQCTLPYDRYLDDPTYTESNTTYLKNPNSNILYDKSISNKTMDSAVNMPLQLPDFLRGGFINCI